MKRILFIFAILISLYTKAQDYKPMLTDGKEWHCITEIRNSFLTDGDWPSVITVIGDTIINNKIYKKLYEEYTDSIPLNCMPSNTFAAYEEDGRIYRYIDPLDVDPSIMDPSTEDLLIMDFNMKAGDKFPLQNNYVADVDTIYSHGEYRKRLKITYGHNYLVWYWVEGIGCSKDTGLLPPEVVPFNIESRIVACYEQGKLVFSESEFAMPTLGIKNTIQNKTLNNKTYSIDGKQTNDTFKGIIISNGMKFIKK